MGLGICVHPSCRRLGLSLASGGAGLAQCAPGCGQGQVRPPVAARPWCPSLTWVPRVGQAWEAGQLITAPLRLQLLSEDSCSLVVNMSDTLERTVNSVTGLRAPHPGQHHGRHHRAPYSTVSCLPRKYRSGPRPHTCPPLRPSHTYVFAWPFSSSHDAVTTPDKINNSLVK